MAAGDWRNMLIFLCGRKSSTLAPKDKRDDAIYRLPAGRQVQQRWPRFFGQDFPAL
jgi:hypothetical protein